MVNKFLLNLAIEYGARVGKSVFNAYQRVINSKAAFVFSHLAGSGAQQTGFGKTA